MQEVQQPISKECPVCGEVFEPESVGSRCPIDNSLLLLRSEHPLVGKVIADRYQLVECIGSGGWSAVFRAQHVSLGREYAIKVLHPHLANDADNLRRFQQEAEAASKLNHVNVATVYDYGLLNNGQPYLVMDYLRGKTLRALLDDNGGKLSWARARNIFLQTCDGLQAAHNSNLIHRDIKPANIMVIDTAPGEVVKILDFGLAKLVAESKDASLTSTGQTIGTPAYMSPEQCMGKAVDHRSDIYSLACVMYETLSGICPFACDSFMEAMNKHLSYTPPSLSVVSPATDAPQRVSLLIDKALSRQEENRQQNVEQLRLDIERASQEISSTKAFLEKLSHGASKVTLKSIEKAVLPVGFLVLLLIGGTAWWFHIQSQNQKQPALVDTHPVAREGISPLDLYESEYGKRLVLQPNRAAAPQLKNIKDPDKYMAVSVASTDFTDDDLDLLLQFRNAREFDLSFTAVSDEGLPTFKKFPQLAKLSFHGDELITDASIDTLFSLPNLRRLNLSLTRVTAHGVKRLGGMRRLRKLHLKSLPVDDATIEALAPLRQLELLDVERTRITDRSMKTIGSFPMLLLLDVRFTSITDKGIAELTSLPHLTVLNLEGTKVTGGCAESFKLMPKLRDIDLADSPFDDKGLARLADIPTLAYLNVTATRVTSAAVMRFRAQSPRVKIDYIEPY